MRSLWVRLACLTFVLCVVLFRCIAFADPRAKAFLPTWKLLNFQEKQQFIAGYLQCWKDTAAILDIAIEYSRTDPERARDALQSLRSLYGFSDTRPDSLVAGIDLFYSNPKNQQASLTKAITAALGRER